ncbi:MAG: hypothetical protein AB7U63_11250, partial [Porticoccaceae bacterium]
QSDIQILKKTLGIIYHDIGVDTNVSSWSTAELIPKIQSIIRIYRAAPNFAYFKIRLSSPIIDSHPSLSENKTNSDARQPQAIPSHAEAPSLSCF